MNEALTMRSPAMVMTWLALLLMAMPSATLAQAQNPATPPPDESSADDGESRRPLSVPFDPALLPPDQREAVEEQQREARERADGPVDPTVTVRVPLSYRSLNDLRWDEVPFSNVPPLDRGFGRVIDPSRVGKVVLDYDTFFRYWYLRGEFQEPATRRAGGVARLGYFDGNAFREIRNIDDFPGFDTQTFTYIGRPRVPAGAFAFDIDGSVRQRFYERYRSSYGEYRFRGATNEYAYDRFYNRYAYTGSLSTYDGPPLLEMPRLINYDIFLAQPQRPEPEPVDPVLGAIEEEAYTRAASVFFARDDEREDEDDRSALRLAAIMIALDGQVERAARHLGEALEAQPDLRETPIDTEGLGLDTADLTSMQARVARAAAKSEDASLWALAATLAEARGSSSAKRVWARYDRALSADW